MDIKELLKKRAELEADVVEHDEILEELEERTDELHSELSELNKKIQSWTIVTCGHYYTIAPMFPEVRLEDLYDGSNR